MTQVVKWTRKSWLRLMMMSNWKKPFSLHGLNKNMSALKGLGIYVFTLLAHLISLFLGALSRHSHFTMLQRVIRHFWQELLGS